MTDLIPVENITSKIFMIRGFKVMLDRDLADLYGVNTKALKQAVKRNIDRFPSDFMFKLNKEEFTHWRSQIVTSSSGDRMGLRYAPMAFTEQGVAMLSSVLNSKRAIDVNIAIMRAFVKMREMLATNKEFSGKLKIIEDQLAEHDEQFQMVFEVIKQLLTEEEKPKQRIGF
ncbi:MAG: ORF6N domain-containing protein [Desulfobacterales bacterium]